MKKSLLAVALTSALAGCSLIPDYQRPAAPVPDSWQGAQASQASPVPQWQAFFNEPQLRELISLALANNRDLRVAALNVEAYRAQYRIQRAELFPMVGANGDGSRARTPADLSAQGRPTVGGQYSATLGVAWELDLFGRLDSLREQALEQYFATEQAQRAAQISLIASVANAWLTWQTDNALLAVTENTLQTYERSLQLTQRSFDVGVASAIELRQAQSSVELARVERLRYQRLQAQDLNALTLLLGQTPPAALLQPRALEDIQLAALPVGLPADVLQQRPDILQAEHQLRAANASIGAARAAFFPRISLTGAAGTASSELSGLFDGGSGYWNFAPSISLPIFNAGQLKANRDYSEVSKNIQVAQYEKAIQVAFREVADGLIARDSYAAQLQTQQALLNSSQAYYQLADRRYRGGVDNYLTVLDAQRQLFSVQQGLLNDRFNQLLSEVNLFKALGGGWQSVQSDVLGDAVGG